MWECAFAFALATPELTVEREAVESAVIVRRWDGRGRALDSSSDGAEDMDCGEAEGDKVLLSSPVKTRAYGARVLKVGLRSGTDGSVSEETLLASCRLGSVKAQLSHGPARRVT